MWSHVGSILRKLQPVGFGGYERWLPGAASGGADVDSYGRFTASRRAQALDFRLLLGSLSNLRDHLSDGAHGGVERGDFRRARHCNTDYHVRFSTRDDGGLNRCCTSLHHLIGMTRRCQRWIRLADEV